VASTKVAGVEELIQRVSGYWPQVDKKRIVEAYELAVRAHAGQMRDTGEPYIVHPVQVSLILAELEADPACIVAGLLHDVVEDSNVPIEQIREQFGDTISRLVAGVTKLSKLDFHSRQEEQARNLRKMFLAMADDIRVLLIKLSDRLHNMRTLDPLPQERREAIARETLHIYAPLAHRLGIWRIKWELEDLALKYLEPQAYFEIVTKLGQTRTQREAQLQEARRLLAQKLEEAGIQAEVQGRVKHIYSIHQKMRTQQLSFEELNDLIALRIITERVSDCYAAVGLVHSLWMPISGFFSDYIAKPKSNNYQSLHTKVIGPHQQPLEVQIRTREMHRTAEYGIAAHWRYKEGFTDPQLDQQVAWLRQLLELGSDLSESHEFLELLQLDLFHDQVFVFTPQGDIIDLPRGAGPIDFAYRIHTEVGHHCVGARVNGRQVPLEYQFENGDIVEIITSPSAKPSRDWLPLIQSSRAKAKVRKFLRQQAREENIERGRHELEEAISHLPAVQREQLDRDKLAEVAVHLNYPDVDSLLAGIGYGDVEPQTVIDHLLPPQYPRSMKEEAQLLLPETPGVVRQRPTLPVSADGVSGVSSRLSKCCNPLPGDSISGYITRGGGLTIHRSDCKNLLYRARKEPERVVPLTWADDDEQGTFPASLEIVAVDRVGLLSHITAVISEADVNITFGQVDAEDHHLARLYLTLEIKRRQDLEHLCQRLEQLIDVINVRQVPTKEMHKSDSAQK